MNTPHQSNDSKRQSLINQIAAITTMRPGSLAEEYRERTKPDGSTVRLGPYFKHQYWLNGRNVSRRVPADQAGQLREDIENGKRFARLAAELAELNIERTLALRAEQASDCRQAKQVKKNSPNKPASKCSAKRNSSSPKQGNA